MNVYRAGFRRPDGTFENVKYYQTAHEMDIILSEMLDVVTRAEFDLRQERALLAAAPHTYVESALGQYVKTHKRNIRRLEDTIEDAKAVKNVSDVRDIHGYYHFTITQIELSKYTLLHSSC